jgi:hypothetical protein
MTEGPDRHSNANRTRIGRYKPLFAVYCSGCYSPLLGNDLTHGSDEFMRTPPAVNHVTFTVLSRPRPSSNPLMKDLEIKPDGKLPVPRAIVDSKNLAEVVSGTRGLYECSIATTSIDIVSVAVEEVVELGAERELVLAI